jgi:hypothetical protein
MASFSVKGDTGTPQTITNNDAVNFAGGTGIETAGVTTDTISITLNANLDDLADVVAGAATNDVLTWQGSSWKAAPPGALATAAGDNTSGGGTKGQIQFNDGTNAFDANEGLFWTSEEGLHVSGSSTSTYDAAITIPTAKKLVFNGGANPPDIFIEADTTYGLKIDGDNYVDIYSDVQTRFMGNGDVIVNYNMGSAATTRIQGDTKRGLVLADASTEQIAIGVPALTSPYDASVAYDSYYNDSIGERPIPEDTGLFVSGSVWGKGKVLGDGIKGVATFGGDLLTSGALWFERKPAGITLPGTLPGNSAVMYAREDTGKTKLFYMDDTGVEHELGAGGMTSFSVDANSSQAGATTISNSQILTVQGGTGISTYIPQAILRRVEISLDADLADLNDVDAATPTNGQALVWDQGKGWWEPGLPAGNMGQQFTSGTVAGRTYSIEGPDIFENLDIQTLGENGTSQWALFNDRQKLDVQEFTIINHNNFGRGAQCQTRQKTEMPDGVEFRMDVPPGATHVKFIVWYFIDSVPTQATKIDLRFAGRMASDFGQAVPGQGAGGPQGGKTPASPDPFEWMDSAAQLSHADSPGWAEFYAGGVPLTLGGPASNMQRATTSDGNTEWMTLAKMINSHDAALFSAASSRIIDVMLVRGSAGASGQSACDIFANPGSSTESNDSYADSIWISAVQALFTTI